MKAPSRRLKTLPRTSSTPAAGLLLGPLLGLLLAALARPQHAGASVATDQRVDLDDPTGFFAPDSLHARYSQRVTFDEYVTYGLRSLSLVAGFDSDLHRYDDPRQLVNSFERNLTAGPAAPPGRPVDSSELALLGQESAQTLADNERNQAECQRHLDWIYQQTLELNRDYESFTQSTRLDLVDFLDSFGGAPREQFMMGNSFWLGAYDQCQQARLALGPRAGAGGNASAPASGPIRGRYCVAQLRLPSWSRSKLAGQKVSFGSESIKLGVCLPRSCNSISILRHANRIEALIRLARLQQLPYSRLELARLYCLPDESSPMRQYSASARLLIGCVSLWLLAIGYFSLKHEFARHRRNQRASGGGAPAETRLAQVFAFRLLWQRLFESGGRARPAAAGKFRRANLKQIAVVGAGPKCPANVQVSILGDSTASSDDDDQDPDSRPASAGPPDRQLNLSAVDGIKVISMMWLISAHTMLFFLRNIANGRQFWSLLLDARFLTIMAGIFPVDSFFTVSGVLCVYLKLASKQTPGAGPRAQESLKRNLSSPAYWLQVFVHRYLRFMPMYLLVFWYTRDLSEFAGRGPMWDYATADSSLRSICKRESLWVPLLFQANFKPIEQHCVKPAWYLANDYQYLLVTPLFLLLLLASKWLGYLVLGLGVAASLWLQFATVYWQHSDLSSLLGGSLLGRQQQPEFTDFEALANFRPMFATHVLKDLWRLYVLPYNRIAPYLVGLLTGHLMHCHNERRLRRVAAHLGRRLSGLGLVACDHGQSVGESQAPPAPGMKTAAQDTCRRTGALAWAFLRHHVNLDVWTPVALLAAVVYLPLASRLLEPQQGERARVCASPLIALMRLVWSLAVARLIFVCYASSARDRHGSFVLDLLASAMWRPWSKICLSVLLVQWEVIGYMAQVQSVQHMTFSLLLAFVLICMVASYALGLLVYLLFELPLAQVEQLYVTPLLFGAKRETQSAESEK